MAAASSEASAPGKEDEDEDEDEQRQLLQHPQADDVGPGVRPRIAKALVGTERNISDYSSRGGGGRWRPSPTQRTPSTTRGFLVGALVLVSACFVFLFAGYQTLELLSTTFRGDLGYYALMMVYAGITPGSFMFPAIVSRTGCRLSMFLGAVPYTVFAGANYGVELELLPGWVLLPAGFGVGFGCAMLGGAQTLYVVQLSREYDRLGPAGSKGSLGLFSGAGQAGSPIGGLLALSASSILMQHAVANRTLILGFFLMLLCGNLLLVKVRAIPKVVGGETKDLQNPEVAPTARLLAIPSLLASSQLLRLLMICTAASG
jgi:MFS family permease